MNDTYRALAEIAQTWGLAYFVGVFLVALAYALWLRRFAEAKGWGDESSGGQP